MYYRPKELGIVVQSVNEDCGTICVDFFLRPDGTYGYEEYRRDAETAEGWFPIGHYSGNLFDGLKAAQAHAAATIGWYEPDATDQNLKD